MGEDQTTKQEIHLFICWRKKNHVPLRLIGGCLSGRTSKINNTLFYCWLFCKDNKLSNFSTAAKSLKVSYPVTMAQFFSILWGVAAHKFCVALLQPVKTIFGPGGGRGVHCASKNINNTVPSCELRTTHNAFHNNSSQRIWRFRKLENVLFSPISYRSFTKYVNSARIYFFVC